MASRAFQKDPVSFVVARCQAGDRVIFYSDDYGNHWAELTSGLLFKSKTRVDLTTSDYEAIRRVLQFVRPPTGQGRAKGWINDKLLPLLQVEKADVVAHRGGEATVLGTEPADGWTNAAPITMESAAPTTNKASGQYDAPPASANETPIILAEATIQPAEPLEGRPVAQEVDAAVKVAVAPSSAAETPRRVLAPTGDAKALAPASRAAAQSNPETPAQRAAAPATATLDMEMLCRFRDSHAPLLDRLIETYLSTAPRALAQLMGSISARRVAEAAEQAQSLSVMSSQLGATLLSDLIVGLRHQVQSDNGCNALACADTVDRIVIEHTAVVEELAGFRKRINGANTPLRRKGVR